MVIRITKTLDAESTILQVDGSVTGESLSPLEAECDAVEGVVVLDLSGVTYVDSAGIDLLRGQQVRRGSRLRHVSPYLAALLKDVELNTPPESP
jgi:anti-anti-sigma regulatory factor